MLKRHLVAAVAVALVAAIGNADPSRSRVTIPVSKTTPTSGKQMYVNYCAPCHGMDGKGHGPVAPALKTPATDLTVLSKNNHGKYPETHIVAVLHNGTDLPSHGTAQMPVWGPILGKMNQTNSQDRLLRISNLSRYLETLQEK